MTELLDQLCSGVVSRRSFMEKIAAAGAGMSLLGVAANAQEKKSGRQINLEGPKYSPANIGGGGRLERNFYREWTQNSQVPMVEGYSIFDARDQEARPWPEIGGRGLYLNFSGNVHMDGQILEIPPGKALVPQRRLYEQLLYVLKGRGHTTVGEGKNAQKVEWGEGRD